MRRLVFSATIDGEDLVRRTGAIRIPDHLRVRVYDDGHTVITTRGNIDQLVYTKESDRNKTRTEILDHLSTLEHEGLVRKFTHPSISSSESEAQRRSFAFGNASVDNERVTREVVDRAADSLSKGGRKSRSAAARRK